MTLAAASVTAQQHVVVCMFTASLTRVNRDASVSSKIINDCTRKMHQVFTCVGHGTYGISLVITAFIERISCWPHTQ
jgi:hypothetical protein